MANLRFGRSVVADLTTALAWYDKKSIALGNRFRAEMDAVFDEIEKSPKSYPWAIHDLNVRFARLRRFPYVVLFIADGSGITVVGAPHGASDPELWRQRAADS